MVPRLTGGKRLLRWLFKAMATSASKYRHCYNVLSVISYFRYKKNSLQDVKRNGSGLMIIFSTQKLSEESNQQNEFFWRRLYFSRYNYLIIFKCDKILRSSQL